MRGGSKEGGRILGGAAAALRVIYLALTPRRRRQLFATLAITILGGVAEMVGIGAVIPFLALVASPDDLRHAPLVTGLFDALGLDFNAGNLFPAVALLIGAALFAAVVRLASLWYSSRFAIELGHDIGVEIFRRILRQPYAELMKRNTSELVSGIEKVQVVVFGILLPVIQGALAAVIALFIVALLIAINPSVALIAAVIVGGVYVVISLATRRVLKDNAEVLASSQTSRIKLLQEGLGGIRDIIIDQSQPIFTDQFRRSDYAYRRSQTKNTFITGAPRFVVEFAGIVVIALIALAMSRQPGGLAATIPVIGAFALGAQRLLPLVQQAFVGWSSLAGNEQALIDVTDLLSLPLPPASDLRRREPLAFAKDIRVEDVGFHYESRRAAAVSGMTFTILKGEWVGFVGKTGSGKSTMVDLLMGLLEPTTGRILVDGNSLTAANRGAWQARIAHVPQHIYLSDDTLTANIAFGEDPAEIDHGRVRDAARRAQIDDFVLALPDGYDSFVGERGVRLSGGQRQRIGLARALYKQADVLILDEATSALDNDTERAVMEALGGLDQAITVIMIAHRTSTLGGCDTVVRMDGGRIVDIENRGRSAARRATSSQA